MKNFFIYRDKPDVYDFNLDPCRKKEKCESIGKVSSVLSVNKEYAEKVFSLNIKSDIVLREFNITTADECFMAFVMCADGLTDMMSVNDFILRSLMNGEGKAGEKREDIIEKRLVPQGQMDSTTNIDSALDSVNIGNAVLFADGVDKCFVIDVKSWEHRSVSNPENEAVIQGPHEGFNEVLRCNTALVRKTLNTPELILENVFVGKTTKPPEQLLILKM